MRIHPLFAAPTRPALAPILFPLDSRGNPSMDDLLYERATALALYDNLVCNPRNCREAREDLNTRQLSWAFRLDARIAQVVS